MCVKIFLPQNKAKDTACESPSFHLCSSIRKGMPPHISYWHPFYLYSWDVFFCCTRINC